MRPLIHKITILAILLLASSCGVNISESGSSLSKFFFGSVPSLKGLISHHSPYQSLLGHAYATACPPGVSIRVHPVQSSGLIDFETIVTTVPLERDATFAIPRDKLPNIDDSRVRYIAQVTGCNDRVLMRPITSSSNSDGEDNNQEITYASTLVATAHSANLPVTLNQVSKTEIESLINSIGNTNSALDAYNKIQSTPSLSLRFEQIFNSPSTALEQAAPKLTLQTASSIPEGSTSELKAIAYHWNPSYDLAYLWKIDGTPIATTETWEFTPGANEQGTYLITVSVGHNDGLGEIDNDLPLTTKNFSLTVQNTILPTPPTFTLDSAVHDDLFLGDTLVHLTLDIGAANEHCQSFSSLALTESLLPPTNPSDFTLSCQGDATYVISSADGAKTLHLWAIDDSNTISQVPSTFNFTLDRNPPELNFINLAASIRGAQPYLIEWQSSDVSGIDDHTLYYSTNGSDFNLIADEITTTSYLWDVPEIDTSNLTIRLTARDGAGNEGELASNTMIVDSTPPVITIDSPAVNTITQGALTLSGQCENGAPNILISGDITESLSVPCQEGEYSSSVNLSGGDGSKSVSINQANSATVARSFIKDTTPPIITFTSPIANTATQGEITINGACESELDLQVSGDVANATHSCTGSTYSLSLNLMGDDGVKNVTLSQTDLAGNNTTISRSFVKDTIPPVLTQTLLNSPHHSNTNTLTIGGACENDLPIIINNDGTEEASISCSSETWSYEVATQTVDATYDYTIVQEDLALNSTEVTFQWLRNTTPPTLTINNDELLTKTDSVSFSGTCDSAHGEISLSGAQTLSISCTDNAWSFTTNDQSVDNLYTYNLSVTDIYGNTSSLSATWERVTIGPDLILSSSASIDNNLDTAIFSGTCDDRFDVEVSGADTQTINCTNNEWSYTTQTQTTDGERSYTFTQRDTIDNITQLSTSWNRDTLAPIIQSLSVNTGDSSTTNRNVVIALSATAEREDIHAFCTKVNTTTQPSINDNCWVSINSLGLSASDTLSINNYPAQLGFTLGTYTVAAWAKDQHGNISNLTQVLGDDTAEIDFTPRPPAVINSVITSSTNSPSIPLAPEDIHVLENSTLYVKWSISDDNPIPAGNIDLLWTEDGTTFNSLASGLSDSINGACTLEAGQTGCAVLANASPTSSYYNVVVSVTNENLQTTISTSNPLNTGSFQLLSGNTSLGLGGNASSAILFGKDEANISNLAPSQFVVTSKGDIYLYYLNRGLAHISSETGEVNIIAKETGSSTGNNGPLQFATFHSIQRILLTHDENLLIWDNRTVRKVNLSSEDKIISILFGGGSDSSDNTPALEALLPNYSSYYPLFTALPNGRVLFEKNLEVWYYDPSDDHVKRYITLGGYGIDDMSTNTRADFDWNNCESRNTAVTYNPVSSEISKIIRRGVMVSSSNCGSHTSSNTNPNHNANFDTITGEAQEPHPGATQHSTINFTGMNGRIYNIHRYQKIQEYNSVTNTWNDIIGINNTNGRCSDGTPALECPTTPKSAFIDRFGKVYFLDLGVIRTIDSEGLVQTIAGQARNYGIGESSLSARYSQIEYFTVAGDNIYVRNELENQIVSFSRTGGPLLHVAGNGVQNAASHNDIAIEAPLENSGVSNPTSFQVDTLSNRLFHRILYFFSYIDLDTGQWNRTTEEIQEAGARVSYLGFNGDKLLAYSQRHMGGTGERTFLYEISLDGLEQIVVAGTGDFINSGSPNQLCDGELSTNCGIPSRNSTPVFQTKARHDNNLEVWLVGYHDRNYISTLPYGGGIINRYITTSHNISAFDYADIGDDRYIYYCSTNGNLYERNMTTNIEVQLPLPSSTISCGGRSLYYDPINDSLIFSFVQNNLWGIAEYLLNDD
jgi:large repetitive protein